jgi:hypothetical protein
VELGSQLNQLVCRPDPTIELQPLVVDPIPEAAAGIGAMRVAQFEESPQGHTRGQSVGQRILGCIPECPCGFIVIFRT